MNLHQLRFVREAVRQNFNLTDAAKALFTSQPGVSKAIIELEDELGVDIFRRHGKRIRGLTEPGRMILNSIELIMQEIDRSETDWQGVCRSGFWQPDYCGISYTGALFPPQNYPDFHAEVSESPFVALQQESGRYRRNGIA